MLKARATGDRRSLHLTQMFDESVRLGQQLSRLAAGSFGHLRLGDPFQGLGEFSEWFLEGSEIHLYRLATGFLRAVSHLMSPQFFHSPIAKQGRP